MLRAKRGDLVEDGEPLATSSATEDDAEVAAREVLAAYEIADVPPDERPVLLDVVAEPARLRCAMPELPEVETSPGGWRRCSRAAASSASRSTTRA